MKIRTDFVTNSSSTNTVEISIENPLLLEILIKYKNLGLIKKGGKLTIQQGPFYCPFNEELNVSNLESACNIGFENYYLLGEEGPGSLNSLLSDLKDIISSPRNIMDLDEDILKELIVELREKSEDITKLYSRVSWEVEVNGDESHHIEQFSYDPVKGENYLWKDIDDSEYE